ncbi:hypothetical protein GLW08_01825 [Pontibacillus yanchengensis]|uniref:Uncharacterized protein n=1 Tax=Pontibacillus yanchengensis TaxID=462910 RepID=A0ACC7VBN6_9BACI|nr:hypothetical protein [Pontibacillus yanchengensis]
MDICCFNVSWYNPSVCHYFFINLREADLIIVGFSYCIGIRIRKGLDMAENNYFSHNSLTYGSLFEIMKEFGFTSQTAGENVAAGQLDPEAVVTNWMNSEDHRANILNENFTELGVGYVQQDGRYASYWVQLFMKPRSNKNETNSRLISVGCLFVLT